jgi:hypothetical protein
MYVQLTLTGTSALLCHNPQMVDPEFEINRQLKLLTSKRKKTDQDLQDIERLEWFGGLYLADMPVAGNGRVEPSVVQPSSKVRKCLVETARMNKLGKQVERALSFTTLNVPLVYEGSHDLNQLYDSGRFTSRLSVVIGGRRIMRVRPSFYPWSLTLRGLFIDDAGLNFDELERIVELAGVAVGIGDNRVNGYGRFEGRVVAE